MVLGFTYPTSRRMFQVLMKEYDKLDLKTLQISAGSFLERPPKGRRTSASVVVRSDAHELIQQRKLLCQACVKISFHLHYDMPQGPQ